MEASDDNALAPRVQRVAAALRETALRLQGAMKSGKLSAAVSSSACDATSLAAARAEAAHAKKTIIKLQEQRENEMQW